MNTAIQAYDPEAQRLVLLERYNSHEHILQWTAFDKRVNRSVVVNYLPASWRLYELNLKYPTAKFDIELILIDQERDFCIVRAQLYIGDTYETSQRRAVAHKQGKLTQLDRIETGAKARAARDFGISTELALDMDDVPVGEVVGTVVTAEPTPAPQQHVVETDEAPRQLPQPTNVQAEPAQPVPANVQPMRPKTQPANPVQPAPQETKLLPSQFNALKNLYLRLNQEVPPDLDKWTFQQAAATITGLQSQLKQAS
jgi:hypothetical protein